MRGAIAPPGAIFCRMGAVVLRIVAFAGCAVDGPRESAYARGSFDMFEASSAGIALARADRTFCRLRSGRSRQSLGKRA
jgi:hypothetical protein